jgi:hypothetical protein
MKKMRCSLWLLASFAMVLMVGNVKAQSIDIGALPASQFCAGDSITITFTAAGNFGHKNAFTLQLSDPSGGFQAGFRNIGSIIDSLSGLHSISTIIPSDIPSSMHYRFRMIAAVPYTAGPDNGSDLAIGSKPSIGFSANPSNPFVGDHIQFNLGSGFNLFTASWNFGSDATPPVAVGLGTQNVVYQSGGAKNITVTVTSSSGCSTTESFILQVLGCMPAIPKDAFVVNDGLMDGGGSSTYWVNPGVTFHSGGSCTIFAEPGSTITSGGSCTIYLKTGASYLASGSGSNIIIYADGASIPSGFSIAYKCASLDFDYKNAPPNAAHPLLVKGYLADSQIRLSPNPTTGVVSIQDAPSNDLNVTVLNLLGETVMELKSFHSTNFTLDLSKLVPGMYYIRISSANSVVTKMVVRE